MVIVPSFPRPACMEILNSYDIFKCGNSDVVSRHIDIEFILGDYFELHEEDALFQSIFTRCNLQKISEESEKEIILYQKL